MASSPLIRALPILAGIVFLAASSAGQGVPGSTPTTGSPCGSSRATTPATSITSSIPTTNRVTGLIRGCPNPHNLTTHPDGLYYYCSNESEDTVDVFDTKTLQLVTQIPLSGNPNKIVVNKKHKKIYAGIRAWTADKRAVVDVIDIATHKRRSQHRRSSPGAQHLRDAG